jgi:hypothetical protein
VLIDVYHILAYYLRHVSPAVECPLVNAKVSAGYGVLAVGLAREVRTLAAKAWCLTAGVLPCERSAEVGCEDVAFVSR